MATYSRITVAQAMGKNGIIPVFYHSDPEVCFEVISACYRGGLRVFEFTNRGDMAHEVFAAVIKRILLSQPEIILGAGSILDASTAALYLQMGANFIVSPILNPEVARVCNRRKVLWSPGCGSVSEISAAEELGAEIIKIFPGQQVGGAEFVKAVKGPMPWTSIMPTGGVDPDYDSLQRWFSAGVYCVGMGSRLIPDEMVRKGDYQGIEKKVAGAVALLTQIRGK